MSWKIITTGGLMSLRLKHPHDYFALAIFATSTLLLVYSSYGKFGNRPPTNFGSILIHLELVVAWRQLIGKKSFLIHSIAKIKFNDFSPILEMTLSLCSVTVV